MSSLHGEKKTVLLLKANRRTQVAARGTTRSSLDSCFQHVNSI